ncbi:AAA family ATPase [Rhodopseudomonas palustris]|uniref:DNA-binding protein n=1 Tax=Rhodopseudomonas palustris TaxID=1076 RepID=A0A418VP48_RHOPL|nr:bifunctional aminoglycoside phosphotransferase/ATP-binding protein [Rhodopseudomonas palustris]RJF77941.1 DNA-binding protein [Rhodopseudomonas palustris]
MNDPIFVSERARQEEVFRFIAASASHGGAPVKRIDTHGAAVFLVGDRALKIKRAVRFPFLDYSTLARRKAACDQELEVNRRFAPQIYHRVVPITRSAEGKLEIGGAGKPLEWAVEMQRFDESRTVDHLASERPLASDLVDAIADAITASHAAAPKADTATWIASLLPIIDDNTSAFKAANFPADAVAALDGATRSAFEHARPLLEQRGAQGFVRWCHGDLHLANIVLIDDRPVLFDAIEFDPAFASVDVLYDLTFPMMDLLHHGRSEAAAELLNRYLVTGEDAHLDALGTLPLLMSLRAAVRAKVTLSRVSNDSEAARRHRCTAESYFALAGRLIAPPPARLIAVGGLSGTGKSMLARALAGRVPPLPGAVVLRSDVIRKQLFNAAETERLPVKAYAPEATAEVYRRLGERAARVLAQGHSAIVDAVFAKADERAAIAAAARVTSVDIAGLYLVADLQTRIARVATRVDDASDATPEIVRQQQAYDTGTIEWITIDASGSPEQTFNRAVSALKLRDQR